MSDNILLEVAKQAPWAVILFAVIFIALRHVKEEAAAARQYNKDMEAMRIAAAKERENERRQHESTLANMQAANIRSLIDNVSQSSKEIAEALKLHEENSKDRYDKMSITKDLLDTARETIARKPR